MNIKEWLRSKSEFKSGCAENAPTKAEEKYLVSESKRFDLAARIIQAAEEAANANKIALLEQMLKEEI